MIRRPPRSTQGVSSAASDVYTRQVICILWAILIILMKNPSKTKNLYLSLNEYKLENSGKLNDNSNIDEWYINNTENILVVKYSVDKISEDDIKSILK